MTIIALRNGVLATDTAVYRSDIRVGTKEKVFRVKSRDGVVLGYVTGSGSMSIIEAFAGHCQGKVDELSSGRALQPPPYPDMSEATGILIGGHKRWGIWIAEKGGFFRAPKAEFYAWGSGSGFAFGAMYSQSTSVNAVAAAIAFDPWCGGEIKHYDVSQFLEGTDNGKL
jgi:ATP-dependent protease HslVU (ClpYQ) peptidase subunit